MIRIHRVFWAAVVLLAVYVGSGRSSAETGLHTQQDQAPHLSKVHEGWRETACFDCHEALALGKDHDGFQPPDCGSCHGYNGAPHDDHAVASNPCGLCHSHVGHFGAFDVPGECIQCHMHPESPKGK